MDSKKIGVIIIIIGICAGIIWIILSNVNDSKENMNITEAVDSLTTEEKQTLKDIRDGKQSIDNMPNAIKDIIEPPSLKKGIEDMLYKDKK